MNEPNNDARPLIRTMQIDWLGYRTNHDFLNGYIQVKSMHEIDSIYFEISPPWEVELVPVDIFLEAIDSVFSKESIGSIFSCIQN